MARELKRVLTLDIPEAILDKWQPRDDPDLDVEVYEKYASELYGLLVLMSGGGKRRVF